MCDCVSKSATSSRRCLPKVQSPMHDEILFGSTGETAEETNLCARLGSYDDYNYSQMATTNLSSCAPRKTPETSSKKQLNMTTRNQIMKFGKREALLRTPRSFDIFIEEQQRREYLDCEGIIGGLSRAQNVAMMSIPTPCPLSCIGRLAPW